MFKNTRIFAESWNVAWRKIDAGNIMNNKKEKFNIIKNNLLYWAADPFLFEYQNDTYIFAELYDYIHCRGTIGYCKLNENGKMRWKKIIIEDYHLSYPYITTQGNDIYIIPESGENNSLYVYKAINFPDKWEKAYMIRRKVKYGDTTPFKYKNHNYALTYDVSDNNIYKLVLLDLEDKNNDTVVGIDEFGDRRPAGKIKFEDNYLLRPAQNCEHKYGEGIIFYKGGISAENKYFEKEILRVDPYCFKYSKDIYLDGMHTYNSINKYEVIDIKTRRFNIINLLFRFINKVGRKIK